jgi:hypothetical protein
MDWATATVEYSAARRKTCAERELKVFEKGGGFAARIFQPNCASEPRTHATLNQGFCAFGKLVP